MLNEDNQIGIKNKIVSFIKKESIFFICAILALISCFFVKPSFAYLDYIDWKTLIILFVMMLVVQSLNILGVFDIIVNKLLSSVKTSRAIIFILVFACFFSSILITNDIALITFVPFAILVLKKANFDNKLIILTVVLQTIAANVGCMILPIGAPHNIFIYSVSGLSFTSFLLILAPYILVSFIFLVLLCLAIKSKNIGHIDNKIDIDRSNFIKRVFFGVDYFLLLTFVALFIFIGNLQNISEFSLFFKQIILGNEVLCGVILSQVISNVPAAILLSGFSANYKAIIVGINLGGFGTLIASIANLISYKIFANEFNNLKIRYLAIFTLLNLVLLAILLVVYFILS